MPYPEYMIAPMREELLRLGVEDLRTPADVDAAMTRAEAGTTLVVVNSVCGCAAANARPAVALAGQGDVRPDHMVTVFAGQDVEATAQMRSYLPGIPPSSPSMALFKDGEPVYVVERRHIEGRSAAAIAADLMGAYQKFCGTDAAPAEAERPEAVAAVSADLPPTFRSIL